jgi:hypothetical protein
MAERRRAPRFLYVLMGLGALFVVVGIIGAVSAGRLFGEAFTHGLFWAYSPERMALRGAGCVQPMLTPRIRKDALPRRRGGEDTRIDGCDDDGYCGREVIHCRALSKNLVPCDTVASIHRKHGKPTHAFEVRTEVIPTFETHCAELYAPDGSHIAELKKR